MSLLHKRGFGFLSIKLTYNPSMTKKIRKAIVFSLVYEIALYLIVLENTYYYGEFIIMLIIFSIPVFAYWSWVFIKSGDSPD